MNNAYGILRVVAYFDVFRYPVTAEEICMYMDSPSDIRSLPEALDMLVTKGVLFHFDGFYSLSSDVALGERRKRGNERAIGMLRTANRIGRALHRFPYVAAVGVSGSLSKDYADADSDIDFFIITRRNRLWIARSLLHMWKKLTFLAGRQHWYCMNYFVDEDALQIGERNIFTATEVVTLKPVAGLEALRHFYTANGWTGSFFPNRPETELLLHAQRSPWYKSFFERVFNGRAGDRLDSWLMRITARRWRNKEAAHKLNSKGTPLALVAEKHVARPNPAHLQRSILDRYAARVERCCEINKQDTISSSAK